MSTTSSRASSAPATRLPNPIPDWSSAAPRPDRSDAPFRIFNIGNGSPVPLIDYVAAIEAALGMTADKRLLPLQPGDVPDTFADTSALQAAVGYTPSTSVAEGVRRFVEWYRGYYGV